MLNHEILDEAAIAPASPSLMVGLLPGRALNGSAPAGERDTRRGRYRSRKPSLTVGLLPQRALTGSAAAGIDSRVASCAVARGSSPTVKEGSGTQHLKPPKRDS
jgi:hypothetical protein